MKKVRISAVIDTWNEEKNLVECISSLGFVDEIIVVDMESTDNTKKIAKQYTDKVFNHPYLSYVEPARNFAIAKASGDWVLVVDPDEMIPASLGSKLRQIAEEDGVDFVRLPRRNLVFDQWLKYSRWWPDYNIRFFKKDYVTWSDAIHRPPVTQGRGIDLDPKLELAIVHHHYRTIDEYLLRLIRYTNQQSKELTSEGYQFSLTDLINKPIGEFLSRFFAGEGYKDGLHGFVVALLQAFSTLVVYLKIWQKEGFHPHSDVLNTLPFRQTVNDKFSELKYWLYTVKIHLASNKGEKFLLKLKRKFKV